jgi:DNA-binding CsgD family transcriptional regulator
MLVLPPLFLRSMFEIRCQVYALRYGLTSQWEISDMTIPNPFDLTQTEMAYLPLLAAGMSNKQIANERGVSINTVKNHLYNISQKMGTGSRGEVVAVAARCGLVRLEEDSDIDEFPIEVLQEPGAISIDPITSLNLPSSYEFYEPDPPAFAIELLHAREQFGHCPTMSMGYIKRMLKAYEREDDRLLLQTSLGVHSVPLSVLQDHVNHIITGGGEKASLMHEILMNRQANQASFYAQAKSGRHFLDICSMRGIQQLMEHGIPARDDWVIHLGGTPLAPIERIWQLMIEVDILERYPNYQLGLVEDLNSDDNDSIVKYMNQNEWVVKGKRTVFLETWGHDEQGRVTQDRFKSTDLREVRKHRDYFLTLWHDRNRVVSDRREVLIWLDDQILRAVKQLASSAMP